MGPVHDDCVVVTLGPGSQLSHPLALTPQRSRVIERLALLMSRLCVMAPADAPTLALTRGVFPQSDLVHPTLDFSVRAWL